MGPHNHATRNKLLRLTHTPCVDGTVMPTDTNLEVKLCGRSTSTEGVVVSPLIEEAQEGFVYQLQKDDIVRILFVVRVVGVLPMFSVLAVHNDSVCDVPTFRFCDNDTVPHALKAALASTELHPQDFVGHGQILDDYGTKYIVYQYREGDCSCNAKQQAG